MILNAIYIVRGAKHTVPVWSRLGLTGRGRLCDPNYLPAALTLPALNLTRFGKSPRRGSAGRLISNAGDDEASSPDRKDLVQNFDNLISMKVVLVRASQLGAL